MKKLKYQLLKEKKDQLEKRLLPILEGFSKSSGLIITGIETGAEVEPIFDTRFDEPKATDIKITYKINIKTTV